MKTIQRTSEFKKIIGLLILFFLATTYGNSQILDKEREALNKPETEIPAEIYWHVKAYRPDAVLLRVKAIDSDGKMHDVKAIQDSNDTSVLNVKALVDGKRLPIKLIVDEDEIYYPVKAIDSNGKIIDIKAITDDGEILDVKGMSRTGNIIHLRAITTTAFFYNLVAVSPTGTMNSVKGIKMMDTKVETEINGVPVFAHVKALKQN